MSLFVAIRPDEPALADLSDALEPVRRMPAAAALRWQPESQWHITLAFLGDADEDVSDEVAERITALGLPVITGIRLAGADCFGRQILWIGIEGDEERGDWPPRPPRSRLGCEGSAWMSTVAPGAVT